MFNFLKTMQTTLCNLKLFTQFKEIMFVQNIFTFYAEIIHIKLFKHFG